MKKEYSIGQICKLYNLGPDSLRYYEKKGLISPKRKKNGYRVYTLDDIWRLNVIKDLRKLDFSTYQIKEYLEKRTIDTTIELMKKEMELIEKEIEPLRDLKENIEKKLIVLNEFAKIEKFEEVVVKKIGRRKILFTEGPMSKDEEVDLAFRKLEGTDDEKLFLFANKDMGVLISEEGTKKGNYSLYQKAFFFVDEKDKDYNMVIPEGDFATLTYRGSYKRSQKLFEKVMDFIKENGYRVNGYSMEIYRLDIHGTAVEEEFITEIQIPIIK
ncbi:MerR family transcriptional regulator [Inediibacterium massiliense]|uniref:MerR family transcriptional regulator n=1 Tax=Inediibacterium massiliense TaxID=1658111 RepID=UPI0006B4CCDF|nr:MerR family transcriptional regulator [Inediibacterium massiliense]